MTSSRGNKKEKVGGQTESYLVSALFGGVADEETAVMNCLITRVNISCSCPSDRCRQGHIASRSSSSRRVGKKAETDRLVLRASLSEHSGEEERDAEL
mmetsp:Transcript_30067/g.30540  ORF Transcript_30067/g.30540 Transcript_30067/m.30540 type:complete len:98 (-) Transcript_30067:1059-1352(-)